MSMSKINDLFEAFITSNNLEGSAVVVAMFEQVYGVDEADIPAGYVDWWVGQLNSGAVTAETLVATSLSYVERGEFAAGDKVAEAQAALKAINEGAETLQQVSDAARAAANEETGEVNIPSNGTFTLTETTIERVTQEATDDVLSTPELVTMWGYTPCADCESGYSGVRVTELLAMLDGLMTENGNGNAWLESLTNFADSMHEEDTLSLDDITDITFGDQTNDSGANNQNVEVTVTFDNGIKHTQYVELTQVVMDHINSLIFDENGNSRLFQEEMHVLRVNEGNADLFADQGFEVGETYYFNNPVVIREGDVKVTEDFFVPIRLTPNKNNGGTLETGYTTNADNTIVVGRLDLLHQAYIDAAGGTNTLEIEAKGEFAQPAQLLNIQNVKIHNLPNIYDYSDSINLGASGSTDGSVADGFFDYGRNEDGQLAPDDTVDQNSTIDLSRATSIEKLTITESGYESFDNVHGSLTVAGIRNGAELHLESGFSQDVNLFYGQGISSNGLNIVLNNVDFHDSAQFNIAHNANTFNINSIGGDNHLNAINGLNAATLSTINVTGTAHLHIEEVAAIFNNVNNRLATFDASENTGGVNIGFIGDEMAGRAEQARINFTGSQADDVLTVAGAVNTQIINVTNASGSNLYAIEADQQINITDGTGGNTYNLTAGEDDVVVNVTAEGEGWNNLTLAEDAEQATITFAGNRNSVTLEDDVEVVNVTMEGARNSLTVEGDTEEVTAVLGDRGVVALEGTNEDVNVTLGGGDGLVYVETADNVVVNAEDGNNTFDVIAESISITAGGNSNTAYISGVANSDTAGVNTIDPAINNGALVNIDLVGTVKLGHPASDRINDTTAPGLTALEGSSITATSIQVLNASNLRQAELTDVENIVLADQLTLTTSQFMELGAGVFSVMNTPIAQDRFQTLNLVVEDNCNLTDHTEQLQMLQDAGIRLSLQVEAGANLTLTAEQLHHFFNEDGITFANSGTSSEFGTVTINGAGEEFDAMANDAGGSIAAGLAPNSNITVNREDNGFERPSQVEIDQLIITAENGETLFSDGIESDTNTLIINGEGNVVFEDLVILNPGPSITYNSIKATYETTQAAYAQALADANDGDGFADLGAAQTAFNIADGAIAGLETALRDAEDALETAQTNLDNAEQTLLQAQETLDARQVDLNKAEATLAAREADVQAAEQIRDDRDQDLTNAVAAETAADTALSDFNGLVATYETALDDYDENVPATVTGLVNAYAALTTHDAAKFPAITDVELIVAAHGSHTAGSIASERARLEQALTDAQAAATAATAARDAAQTALDEAIAARDAAADAINDAGGFQDLFDAAETARDAADNAINGAGGLLELRNDAEAAVQTAQQDLDNGLEARADALADLQAIQDAAAALEAAYANLQGYNIELAGVSHLFVDHADADAINADHSATEAVITVLDGIVGDNAGRFTINFSDLNGTVDIEVGRFEQVGQILGNGTAEEPATVKVQLNGNVGTDTDGLVSSGVQTYLVTDLNDANHAFWTCDTTQDLEVLGLRGNHGNSITFGNTERDVEFRMEVAYDKFDGFAVGTLVGNFARPNGATATFNVVGLEDLPAGETQIVGGISTDATTVEIDVQGGNTVIEALTAANATSLTLDADANLTVQGDLPAALTSIDASGVTGSLTATLANNPATGLAFIGALAATSLTVQDAAAGEIASIEGAGEISLTIDGDADLSQTTLDNVTAITINEGDTLTLTTEQVLTLGEAAIQGEGTISVIALADQVIDTTAFGEDLDVQLTTAAGEWTLDAASDLTNVAALTIGEESVVTMTAEQVLAVGADANFDAEADSELHITGVTQAHLDDGLEAILSNWGGDVTIGTITLVEDVTLTGNYLNAATVAGNFTLIGDDTRVDVNMNIATVGTDADNGVQSTSISSYIVTDTTAAATAYSFFVCNDTLGLQTLGLQLNAGNTITFGGVKRGVDFLLEGDGVANWDELEKEVVNTDVAAIGAIVANFYTANNPNAIVNINNQGVTLGEASDGGVRTMSVEGITINNTLNVEIHVEDGSASLGEFAGDQAETLTITNADGDVSLALSGEGELTSIDAEGVAGEFTLNITGHTDLSETTLTGVDAIEVATEITLTLNGDQAEAFNEAVIGQTMIGGTLNIVDFDNAFDADLLENMSLGTVTTAEGDITLDPAVNLSGAELRVPENGSVTLTAAQFNQLDGKIEGVDGNTDFTINITDLTQADIDAGFDLSDITGQVNVTLAQDIAFNAPGADVEATWLTTDLANLSIDMGDFTLNLANAQQADGLQVTGTGVLELGFDTVTSGTIDASGFDVPTLKAVQTFFTGTNDQNDVEVVLANLPGSTTLVITAPEDLGLIAAYERTVILEEGVRTPAELIFNDQQDDREITVLNLEFQGDARIRGELDLSTVLPKEGYSAQNLQALNIHSTGEAGRNGIWNPDGSGDWMITAGDESADPSTENNLLYVNITGDQAFRADGIEFSYITNSREDDDGSEMAAMGAELTVNNSEAVRIDTLDVSDTHVNALTVTNSGAGTLTLGVVGATVTNAPEGLSFLGDNIALVVDGTVDLSNADLEGVSSIHLDDGTTTLTLTAQQLEELGFAALTAEDTADLQLVDFDDSHQPFDVADLGAGITLTEITLAEGETVTLDAATNLGQITTINVPADSTLNLTAAQYMAMGQPTISGDGNVNVSELSNAQASIDLSNVTATGDLTLTLADDVGIPQGWEDDDNPPAGNLILGVTDLEGVVSEFANLGRFDLNLVDGDHITLTTLAQANDRSITGTEGATVSLALLYAAVTGNEITFEGGATANGIQAEHYSGDFTLEALTGLLEGQNVEEVLANLASSITVQIVDPLDMPGAPFAAQTHRVVVVEEGVTVGQEAGTSLVFADLNDDRLVKTLDLTLMGDSTIQGAIDISTIEALGDFREEYFERLTINSLNDANTIGNITAGDVDAPGGSTENNLLNVIINAEAALTGGTIEFSSVASSSTNATANLTVDGAADVEFKALDTSDAHVTTLNVTNDGGTLTLTGGSPGGNLVATNTLNLSGDGDIVFGTEGNPGINGGDALSTINATGLSGDLTINTLNGINEDDFTFTAGTGETKVTLNDVELDENGEWEFNFVNATGNSELILTDEPDFSNGGELTIVLGDNTTLRIDENTDFTDLDELSITGNSTIVVAAGKTLTLTAAQADMITEAGLTVVGAGAVVIEELMNADDTSPVYDFSAFDAVADNAGSTIKLGAVDVNVHEDTILSQFSITLEGKGVNFMDGQTIRFNNAVQAEREIIVDDQDGTLGTNVIWDFDEIVGTENAGQIDTRDYSSEIGRLWIYEGLADGSNVENLYTVLANSTIVRLATREEFAAIQDGASGTPITRNVEVESFVELENGLSFSALDITVDPQTLQFIANLGITLGGEVELGDLILDNVIGAPTENSPDFDTLTINSRSANSQNHYLLPEGFEDGALLPDRINTIGDIASGDNRDQLFNVVINTGVEWNLDEAGEDGAAIEINSIAFSADDIDLTDGNNNVTLTVNGFYTTTVGTLDFTHASLTETDETSGETSINVTLNGDGVLDVTDAMEFDSLEPNTTVNLTVEGTVDVNGKTLALSPDIEAIVVTNNSTGDVNITGGSPAISGENLETLTVNADSGNVVIGIERLEDDEFNLWGINTPALTELNVEGGENTTIVLASVNGEDFTYNVDSGAGENMLALDGVELADGGVWNFEGLKTNSQIAITGESTFGAGELVFTNSMEESSSELVINGDVDLTAVTDIDITVNGGSFNIAVLPDANLSLTPQQLSELREEAAVGIVKEDGDETDGTENGHITVVGEGDLRELTLTDADALEMTGYTRLDQSQLEAFEGSIDKNAHILDVELQQAAVNAWPTEADFTNGGGLDEEAFEEAIADLLEALAPVDNFVVNGIVNLRGVDEAVFEAIFEGGRTLSIDAGGAVLMTDEQEAYFAAQGGVIEDEGTDLLVDEAFLALLTDGDLRDIRGLDSIQIVVASDHDPEEGDPIAAANENLVLTAAQALDIPTYAVTVDVDGNVERALVNDAGELYDETTDDIADFSPVESGDFRSVLALGDVNAITVHVDDNRDLTSLQGLTSIVLDESEVEITVTVDQAALVMEADTDTVTIITELDGSNANLSGLAGTVRLDTEGNDIAFNGTLAVGTTYEVIGGGSLDLTQATIGANASFDLIGATDLVMTAEDLNTVITGTGDITDTGNNSTVTAANLHDATGLDLEGVDVNRFVATVDVSGGVTLTGDLADAELVVIGSNDNGTDTLNVVGTDRGGFGTISSIDFGSFEFTVQMTGNTFRGISESFGGENATVIYTTESGEVSVWEGDTLGTLRFENGNNIIHTMNGLTDTINVMELNDNNLRELTLNFVQGVGEMDAIRVLSADALDVLEIFGDTSLDVNVLLGDGSGVSLGSSGANRSPFNVTGETFRLEGTATAGDQDLVTVGTGGRTVDLRNVTESATFVAGEGGLKLEKTSGGSNGVLWVNSLDTLTFNATAGDILLESDGRTLQMSSSNSIGTVDIQLGDGEFTANSVSGTAGFQVGTFTSAGQMNVSGDGTATIDVLDLTLNGANYTLNVGTDSELVIQNASGMNLAEDSLILTGAGTIEIGDDEALDITVATLNASGLTGSVDAELHADAGNATVLLGAGDETYELTRDNNGSFNFTVNATDNGTVEITGFAPGTGLGVDILNFGVFEWNTTANEGEFNDALDNLIENSEASFTLNADGIDGTGTEFLVFTEAENGDVVITGDGITGSITLLGVADDLEAGNFAGINFSLA